MFSKLKGLFSGADEPTEPVAHKEPEAPRIITPDTPAPVAPPPPPPPPPSAVPDTVKVSDRTFHRTTAKLYGLRKGMFVFVPDHGVGILTNLYENGSAVVMLIDDGGFNKLALARTVGEFRQAKYNEIPVPRRPSVELAHALKYL